MTSLTTTVRLVQGDSQGEILREYESEAVPRQGDIVVTKSQGRLYVTLVMWHFESSTQQIATVVLTNEPL